MKFASLLLLSLALVACSGASGPVSSPIGGPGIPDRFDPKADLGRAPDVEMPTIEGGSFNLARQGGKVVLVYLTPF